MKLHSRTLAAVSLLIGLALFVHVIAQTGLGDILTRIRSLGAGFLLILAISFIRQFVRAYAWLRCLPPQDRTVGWFALMRGRLAGDAIGDLTSGGPLVAEPLKVLAMGSHLPMPTLISSLAVENLAYAFSSCVMILAGTLALLATFTLSDSLRAASFASLGVVALILLLSIIVVSRRVKLLSTSIETVLRVTGLNEKLSSKLAQLCEMESYIFDFYARRPVDFLLTAACEITFHIAGVAEIFVALWLIGLPVTWLTAFILEAVNRIINIVFAFVPAMMGVDEAGTELLSRTLSLSSGVGVTLAVIRKARMFFWIALGLIFLAVARQSTVKEKDVESRQKA
jgi:hypothetical protein